jgi:hypothetical protein
MLDGARSHIPGPYPPLQQRLVERRTGVLCEVWHRDPRRPSHSYVRVPSLPRPFERPCAWRAKVRLRGSTSVGTLTPFPATIAPKIGGTPGQVMIMIKVGQRKGQGLRRRHHWHHRDMLSSRHGSFTCVPASRFTSSSANVVLPLMADLAPEEVETNRLGRR